MATAEGDSPAAPDASVSPAADRGPGESDRRPTDENGSVTAAGAAAAAAKSAAPAPPKADGDGPDARGGEPEASPSSSAATDAAPSPSPSSDRREGAENDAEPAEPEKEKKKPPFRLKPKHLLLPYLVGLVWILLHPAASVVTGELKCRGIFVDESALEPQQLSIGPYPLERGWALGPPSTAGEEEGGGLCDALRRASAPSSSTVAGRGSPPRRRRRVGGERGSMECVSRPGPAAGYGPGLGPGFDVALIVPPSAPVRPAESLAVVVPAAPPPSPEGWVRSDFHVSVLHLIDRLSDPGKAPWLAKNVLVVSPRGGGNATKSPPPAAAAATALEEAVVSDFLDAYLGAQRGEPGAQMPPSLPPRYSSSMLRTVLVLDASASSGKNGGGGSVSLLPQGRRGVLPNLDLFFASVNVYRYLRFLGAGGNGGRLWAHPYRRLHLRAEKFINGEVESGKARRYLSDLAGMALFALSMVRGPYPPHAPALRRGVDALTVRAALPPRQRRGQDRDGTIDPSAAELLQRTEQLLRALSNAHERLHHSVSQYLLPSPYKFVSNGEYTYPCVLLALPLAARAAASALADLRRFGFAAGIGAGTAAALTAGAMGAAAAALGETHGDGDGDGGGDGGGARRTLDALLALCYAASVSVVRRLVRAGSARRAEGAGEGGDAASRRRTSRRSLQFVACLAAVYLHVPLLLSHASLAAPSLLLWTPALAFPRRGGEGGGAPLRAARGLLPLATSPPALFAAAPALGRVGYTPYVWGVYAPLHLLMTLMWLF